MHAIDRLNSPPELINTTGIRDTIVIPNEPPTAPLSYSEFRTA